MADLKLVASTIRSGVPVDEVELQVGDAPPATGYLLGQHGDDSQPIVLALHDERGDKASMLPDVEHLAARGFVALSLDSPVTRRAAAARDPLGAFESQLALAQAALASLGDARDHRSPIAIVGRGIGGEVAAVLAAMNTRVRVVVAIAALPDRSDFIENSPHALAAGLRQFNDSDEVIRQITELRPRRLVDQLESATHTQWLLQVPEDDDRFSDRDHATMSLAIPRTVRVEYVAHARDLAAVKARRTRVDFISKLCG